MGSHGEKQPQTSAQRTDMEALLSDNSLEEGLSEKSPDASIAIADQTSKTFVATLVCVLGSGITWTLLQDKYVFLIFLLSYLAVLYSTLVWGIPAIRAIMTGLIFTVLFLGAFYLINANPLHITTETVTVYQSSKSASLPQVTLPADVTTGGYQLPNIKDPNAIQAQDVCPGYQLVEILRSPLGLEGRLDLAGDACNVYGTDVEQLTLRIEYQDDDRLRVAIFPTNQTEEVIQQTLKDEWVPKPMNRVSQGEIFLTADLQFIYTSIPTFGFKVVRISHPDDVLFSTMGKKIVFENQFIEVVTDVPQGAHFYGLGESFTEFMLKDGMVRTMYANDQADPVDENIYGFHPVLLSTRYHKDKPSSGDNRATISSRSHGLWWRDAHGMEVLLRPNKTETIIWRTLGGTIDLYFFSGGKDGTAKGVIESYTKTIGLPTFQQYWTLGFHQCRWGYENLSMLEDVITGYRDANIPLETVWLDIDYMDGYKDFTTDPVQFPLKEVSEFLKRLHAGGQKFVPIIDAAIYVPNPSKEEYAPFTIGNESQVFMREAPEDGGELYIGAVWPGYTAFPDWFTNNTQQWWSDNFLNWSKEVDFDGIWIDMNEVASFCVGSCGKGKLEDNPVHPPFKLPGEPGYPVTGRPENIAVPTTSTISSTLATHSSSETPHFTRSPIIPGKRNLNYPPYAINHFQPGSDLAVHAVSPNATHLNGTVPEYDLHSLFGHMMGKATYNALLKVQPKKRPFIISRSTFSSSGRYVGHWGGDNASKFAAMALSIAQALSFSIYGIPFFGVDTCGFDGNTSEELCNRWMQLSAFFPFYRNHNILGAEPQEAYLWESVAQASRKAMNIRYHLLPYWYTLLWKAHVSGSTVMRALAWEFPNDPRFARIDRQFLVGSSIMVIPVLTPNATSVHGIFPTEAIWYDWYTQDVMKETHGKNVSVPAPLGHIPVYIRGGSIIPLQRPGMTTAQCRQGDWSILIALSQDNQAHGELYIDDGESIEPKETLMVNMVTANNTLAVSGHGSYKASQPLANITVMGLGYKPEQVLFDSRIVNETTWIFDSKKKLLVVTNMHEFTNDGAWLHDWQLTWA